MLYVYLEYQNETNYELRLRISLPQETVENYKYSKNIYWETYVSRIKVRFWIDYGS